MRVFWQGKRKFIKKKNLSVYLTLNMATVGYGEFFHNYIFHFPTFLFLLMNLTFFPSHSQL